jgi:hypothetical protein
VLLGDYCVFLGLTYSNRHQKNPVTLLAGRAAE